YENIRTNIGEPFGIFHEITGQLIHKDSTGVIDITVRGGKPPYSYEWSVGAINEDLDSVPAGIYTVTVTDDTLATVTKTIELGYRISWSDLTNTTSTGHNLESTGGSGWIHGGFSENYLGPYEDGYVEFRIL